MASSSHTGRPPNEGCRSQPSAYFQDNGFVSLDAMERAHAPIVSLVSALRRRQAPLVDLGCGNGALLERCKSLVGDRWGVECDAARAASVAHVAPHVRAVHGSIFKEEILKRLPLASGVVLFMPGRMLEVQADAQRVLRKYLVQASVLVLYAYSDWADEFGGLKGLAQAAQFTIGGQVFENDLCTAACVVART